MNEKNRESWLTALAKEVEPLFTGFTVAPYRVTCGWPSSKGLARKGRVLGECFGSKSSKAGLHEIFVSPTLDEPIEVAGVLTHELTHVVAGIEAKHGAGFVEIAKHVGLTKGKPTSAMPGERLNERLRRFVEGIGPYPHVALAPVTRLVKARVTSVGLVCTECGCKVTISVKWLDEAGKPTCGCGSEMEIKKLIGKEMD